MNKNAILIFLALFVFAAAGCQPKIEAVSKRVIGNSEVSVVKGQTLKLELEANPTTGYMWEIEKISPDGLLEKAGDYSYRRQFNLIGGGGLQIFSFNAVKKGEAELGFVYRRPWEDKKQVAKKFNVRVLVR
ncbi:MAG: protease inhibitor I42 family protein [Candidatus Omnitrophica bacterium]|nr:protease inhibitor I42 family protein [Candidatus Omnitrophota bacterium]